MPLVPVAEGCQRCCEGDSRPPRRRRWRGGSASPTAPRRGASPWAGAEVVESGPNARLRRRLHRPGPRASCGAMGVTKMMVLAGVPWPRST